MYCRINRVFHDLQNWSYSDGRVANSKEQLLWHYAIVMFVFCNLIRIYQKGLNLDRLSKVRMPWTYIDCTLIWINQKQLYMANSTSRGGSDLKKSRGSLPVVDIFFIWHIHIWQTTNTLFILFLFFENKK